MKAYLIHCIKEVKFLQTKFGYKALVNMDLKDFGNIELWMSFKQGECLSKCFDDLKKYGGYSNKKCECYAILEKTDTGHRFVWGGKHSARKSDLPFLREKFGVEIKSQYIGEIDNTTKCEVHKSLED